MIMTTQRPVMTQLGLAAACLLTVGCDSNYPLCAQNLHQIGSALHEFHDAQGSFPMAAITDKEGKPGLSWRVAILPYLGHDDLYKKFALEEPWDSPHNRQLLGSMPAIFVCPSASRGDPWLTSYRAFSGNGSFFEPAYDARLAKVWWTDPDGTKHYQPAPTRGLSIAQFVDGPANTLMIVEAKEAVPWTKPDEFPFDPAHPARAFFGAGSPHRGGFNAVFVDGALRFIKSTTDPHAFRAMVTRNGGEIIVLDQPAPGSRGPAEPTRGNGVHQPGPDGAMYKAISRF
jgi:prepilin-type processing-associated H-X9-DG protein